MDALTTDAVLEDVDALLAGAASTPRVKALLAAAVAPALAIARHTPCWPVIALPLAVTPALGGDTPLTVRLASASLLFFASADVCDDAQDGDWCYASWQAGVNVSQLLLFLAIEAAQTRVTSAWQGEVAQGFARAGLAMSLGQQRDLDQRGDPDGTVDEPAYLDCIAGKAGGSFALFASVGALALGHAAAGALAAFGRALGMAVQLASDLGDLAGAASRDRRNQLLTLPVIEAWHRLTGQERTLLLASWHDEPDAAPLSFLLERSGALNYARSRLAVLHTEALMHLEAPFMPLSLVEPLGLISRALQAQRPSGLA